MLLKCVDQFCRGPRNRAESSSKLRQSFQRKKAYGPLLFSLTEAEWYNCPSSPTPGRHEEALGGSSQSMEIETETMV